MGKACLQRLGNPNRLIEFLYSESFPIFFLSVPFIDAPEAFHAFQPSSPLFLIPSPFSFFIVLYIYRSHSRNLSHVLKFPIEFASWLTGFSRAALGNNSQFFFSFFFIFLILFFIFFIYSLYIPYVLYIIIIFSTNFGERHRNVWCH